MQFARHASMYWGWTVNRVVKASDLLLQATRIVADEYNYYGLQQYGACSALNRAAKAACETAHISGLGTYITQQYWKAFQYFDLFKPEPRTSEYWFGKDIEHRLTALLMARAMALAEGN